MTSKRPRLELTPEQRRMYAAEKMDNFRWAAKILASYSDRLLTNSDEVPREIAQEIAEIGQFSEIVYTTIPLNFLLGNYSTLNQPGFPLEGYNALGGVVLLDSIIGDVAKLPAAIFYRPSHSQVVVSIAGTSKIEHALYDVNVRKTKHPSGKGNVHTGFWQLYRGLHSHIKEGLRRIWEKEDPTELVVTGHSMGGAISYLLSIDLLSSGDFLPAGVALKLVTFGTPRAADASLVDHYNSLADGYRRMYGENAVIEYSLRAYNDGVPTLPPLKFGYRHFAKIPIYATGNQLYYVPSAEREHALFHVENSNGESEEEVQAPIFPRGGHNYYNGRELERLLRRLTWLDKARKVAEEKWQPRYLEKLHKHS